MRLPVLFWVFQSLFYEYANWNEDMSFSCFGKKRTKRSRHRRGVRAALPRVKYTSEGPIAPGNRLFIIRCAEHHPLLCTSPVAHRHLCGKLCLCEDFEGKKKGERGAFSFYF